MLLDHFNAFRGKKEKKPKTNLLRFPQKCNWMLGVEFATKWVGRWIASKLSSKNPFDICSY